MPAKTGSSTTVDSTTTAGAKTPSPGAKASKWSEAVKSPVKSAIPAKIIESRGLLAMEKRPTSQARASSLKNATKSVKGKEGLHREPKSVVPGQAKVLAVKNTKSVVKAVEAEGSVLKIKKVCPKCSPVV